MDAKTRARIGGLTCAAKHDMAKLGAKGRASLIARLEREVDPDGTMDPQERARKGQLLYRAHMLRVRQGKKA